MKESPKARCVICGMIWNISAHQRIPSGGYICPHCDGQRRSGDGSAKSRASNKERPAKEKEGKHYE